HHGVAVGDGVLGQTPDRGDAPVADELEGPHHLELLDVLGEVAARHALVDVLVSGEVVELLDAGLDVVPGDALTLGDRAEVHTVDHRLVVLDHAVGDVDPQVALGAHHRDPQLPLEHDLVLGGPQRGQVGARVARGEDVGNAGLAVLGGHAPQYRSPVRRSSSHRWTR